MAENSVPAFLKPITMLMNSQFIHEIAVYTGQEEHMVTAILLGAVIGLSALAFMLYLTTDEPTTLKDGSKLPPVVPGPPFIGSAIEYGTHPVNFLLKCQKQYGDIFTFKMFGQKMTACLGPEGNHFVFNIPVSTASAEAIYQKLTTPVFGAGVVYDCPNSVLMEQKKFIKDSLTTAAFKSYMPIFKKEFNDFFKRYDREGKRVLFTDLAELTIMTASACLQGPEIRSQMDGKVARLYHDLDQGLTPMNLIFTWLPTPTYIKRDIAHKQVVSIFKSIIKKRRQNDEHNHTDVLQGLMNAQYRGGKTLSDDEIAHLLIALLMAGQHTSSTTMSWTLFRLAANKEYIAPILQEQSIVLTGKKDTPLDQLPDITYEAVRNMPILENTIKEALRLHPPIHTVLRKMAKTAKYGEYTIPEGHNICACPSVSQLDPDRFPNRHAFDPMRHANSNEGSAEWTLNGVDVAEKSARSHLLPFGAGRHRCIGESFAYVQLKTLISLFLRKYDIDLPTDKKGELLFPEPNYHSLITMPKDNFEIIYKERAPGITAQQVHEDFKKQFGIK